MPTSSSRQRESTHRVNRPTIKSIPNSTYPIPSYPPLPPNILACITSRLLHSTLPCCRYPFPYFCHALPRHTHALQPCLPGVPPNKVQTRHSDHHHQGLDRSTTAVLCCAVRCGGCYFLGTVDFLPAVKLPRGGGWRLLRKEGRKEGWEREVWWRERNVVRRKGKEELRLH